MLKPKEKEAMQSNGMGWEACNRREVASNVLATLYMSQISVVASSGPGPAMVFSD